MREDNFKNAVNKIYFVGCDRVEVLLTIVVYRVCPTSILFQTGISSGPSFDYGY